MRPTPQQLLKAAKTPSLLLTDGSNIRYLTGMKIDDGVILVRGSSLILFVGKLDHEMVQKDVLKDKKVSKVVKVRLFKGYDDLFKGVRVCGFEAKNVTVQRHERWKKVRGLKLKPVTGVVEQYRRSKEEDELRALLRAHAITEELLERVPSALVPGITERALAWQLDTWAREAGAEGMAFGTIVAFGTNTAHPHHQPLPRKLKKGDLVQIDVGARYDGYCGDRSAVYFTAPPTDKQQKVYEALQEAKDAAIDAVEPGVSVRELDRIARAVLKKHGLDRFFIHSLGHGVGLDIHEGVTLSLKGPDDRLLEHEVITIEPGVYMPGKFGMRLEDMVVVQ